MSVDTADTDEAGRKRSAFRRLLAGPGLTVMPGGFGPLYARAAEIAGFDCFFIAGSQMSAYLLGVPDNGILGLRDVVDHVRHAAARTSIPIFVDCDTGFGNAVNVHYAVQEVVRTGVAGLQIEDQEAPKKSGTSAGRRLISIDEAIGKIRAAVAARDAIDRRFVICARTDSLGAEGGSLDDAIERGRRYVRDGGADLVWLNSVPSREALARACREIPAPVLTIWGGATPGPTLEEYAQLGVRIALFPVVAATAGLQGAWEVLHDFRARGTAALVDLQRRVGESPFGRASLGELVGIDEVRRLEDAFLSSDARRDYEGTWGHAPHLRSE